MGSGCRPVAYPERKRCKNHLLEGGATAIAKSRVGNETWAAMAESMAFLSTVLNALLKPIAKKPYPASVIGPPTSPLGTYMRLTAGVIQSAVPEQRRKFASNDRTEDGRFPLTYVVGVDNGITSGDSKNRSNKFLQVTGRALKSYKANPEC